MLDLLNLNLTAFDGGAAAGGEGATGGNGNSAQDSGQPAMPGKKGGQFDNVVFGKRSQAEPAGAEAKPIVNTKVEKTPKERKAAFEELIKGEYKDEYAARFQKEFDKRFRGQKELEEKFNKADRLLGLIAEKYGEKDISKLESKILNDNAHLEQEAIEKGMTVEQLAEIKKLKAEAESERRRRERIERESLADRQYQKWVEDASVVKQTFPDFDINAEIKNPEFMGLLQRGIGVEHAYKILHFDELVEGSVSEAMKKSAKATADTIAARGSRPKENSGSGSAVIYKTDVSKLSKAERAEIARRVARGEEISF